MNKFHYASHTTTKKEPKKVLQELKKTDFDGLEILAEGKHTLKKHKNIKTFKEATNNLSITVHAPYHNINLASENEKQRKKSVDTIKELIKKSKEINAQHLTIHPGHQEKNNHLGKKMAWEQNLKSFKEIAETAKQKELQIGIENMPKMPKVLGKNQYEINGLIESINNEYLSISLDIGHANTTNQINEFLTKPSNIKHMHLHDNFGRKDKHLAIGKGDIDYKKIIEKINGYQGIYVIEARNIKQGEQGINEIKKLIN